MKKKRGKPKEQVKFAGTAKLMFSPEYTQGSMGMKLGDSCLELSDAETGKKVGYVCACIGGGIELQIGEETWGINMGDLWRAVRRARDTNRADKNQEEGEQ